MDVKPSDSRFERGRGRACGGGSGMVSSKNKKKASYLSKKHEEITKKYSPGAKTTFTVVFGTSRGLFVIVVVVVVIVVVVVVVVVVSKSK
jgi:hypothetical protein